MKRSKGYRIQQSERMVAHAKKLLKEIPVFGHVSEAELDNLASRFADNYTRCSCEMCRNPRHSNWYNKKNKRTIQERRETQREIV